MVRWLLKVLAGLSIVVVAAWSVVAIAAFYNPRVDPPGDPDAFYTLHSGGGVGALHHLDDWLPPGTPLLVSVPDDELTLDPYEEICSDPTLDVTCVAPDPLTTQGEARNLGRIAEERGWQSVAVISQKTHMTRARVLMERCYSGEVRMVPRPVRHDLTGWIRVLVYESGAMVKTWLTPEC